MKFEDENFKEEFMKWLNSKTEEEIVQKFKELEEDKKMSADEKERLEKIEFSIGMLHFHNYINDTQFIKMIDKLNKEIKSIKEK